MREGSLRALVEARVHRPGAVAEAAAARVHPTSLLGDHGRLMMIAADHPARGALRAGNRAMAMGDRTDLLDRLCLALSRPGVNGVLGTPDVLEDLLLLGALDGKVVVGSMNRGGLAGTVFEIDDRFTAYDAAGIAAAGFDGGKMLTRIDPDDPATAVTLEACARAVTDLAGHGLMAMVEPFISHRVDGRVRNELTADAMTRAMAVAAGLGGTSAHTWLKVPIVDDMERAMAATTLPALILGGEVSADPVFAELGDVDSAALLLTLDDGSLGLISNSRYNARGYDVRLEVHGATDSVAAGLDDGLPLHPLGPGALAPAGPPHTFFMDRLAAAFRAEPAAFTDVVAGTTPSPCTVDDALETAFLAEAAVVSLREHRPVRLEEVR